MRSRERLIDVLLTVNFCPGITMEEAALMRVTGSALKQKSLLNAYEWGKLTALAKKHGSQHIRDLASEALAYVVRGNW